MHHAKGLEADYVVIRGLCSGEYGQYGFPSEFVDDPLLDLVRSPVLESHPDAEERRLLYVALTRARHHVYLLAEGEHPSKFVEELLDGKYDVEQFGQKPKDPTSCPSCNGGRLMLRKNTESEEKFWSCAHWLCEYTTGTCPECRQGLPVLSSSGFRCESCEAEFKKCPRCEGYLRERKGHKSPYRQFLGCSNFPKCEHKIFCPECRKGLPIPVSGDFRFRCESCRIEFEACPTCGWRLVPRTSYRGPFLGCSSYPKCTYLKDRDPNNQGSPFGSAWDAILP